jgi:molybdate transport system substrate-binding protein
MKRRLLAALIAAAALGAPGACTRPGAGPGEVVVFAAASLTEAFDEIKTNFCAANPGVVVTFNFGGSQQLAQQIGHGARCDVFASANRKQMDAAVDAGRVDRDAARTFARNRLVVVAPRDNPAKLGALFDLSTPGLKIVLAAKEVPAGQYALEMLDRAEKERGAGFRDAVLKNVVSYEQDVRAVLAKVSLGEADAGVVYASDASGSAGERVTTIGVPDSANVVAEYPIATLADSRSADLAKRFVDYVLSPDGQRALAAHGFLGRSP